MLWGECVVVALSRELNGSGVGIGDGVPVVCQGSFDCYFDRPGLFIVGDIGHNAVCTITCTPATLLNQFKTDGSVCGRHRFGFGRGWFYGFGFLHRCGCIWFGAGFSGVVDRFARFCQDFGARDIEFSDAAFARQEVCRVGECSGRSVQRVLCVL